MNQGFILIFGSSRAFVHRKPHFSVKLALAKHFQLLTFKIFIFLFQELLNVFYICMETRGHISSTLDFSVLAKIFKIKLLSSYIFKTDFCCCGCISVRLSQAANR